MKRKLEIVQFKKKHAPRAKELAHESYIEECGYVPSLTKHAEVPDPARYDNGLGVTAFHGGKMVGFLCCLTPFDNFFGTSKGTYVPVNAHAAVKEDRKRIYSRLYEAAADVWVREGILSHAIGVYSHDISAIESLFENGFGMRTIDAIRTMEEVDIKPLKGIGYRELQKEEYKEINPMRNRLISHLNSSPMFMPHRQVNEENFLKEISNSPRRYFVADLNDGIIAYIKITEEGESFIGDQDCMANIQGAYMNEEYRGSGIYTNLLAYVIRQLRAEGYTHIGVDCESFNPTARGFWLKYFTPYIYGLTRRIDERIAVFYK
ncbi:MAG: GNAT family N-acetyltransferase [Clostridia bacterium]|nr:GNAT family N-acetyltransferase [Clostridia bacterium]